MSEKGIKRERGDDSSASLAASPVKKKPTGANNGGGNNGVGEDLCVDGAPRVIRREWESGPRDNGSGYEDICQKCRKRFNLPF